MAITIRHARPDDDEAIGALLVEAFVVRYAEKMPEVEVGEERRRDLRDVAGRRARATVLVAEEAGRVVGTVTMYAPGAEDSEAWIAGAANLRYLAVATDRFGGGLAGALMDAAEGLAREWGATAVCLHARRGVSGVARVYTRRGYRRDPAGDLDLLPLVFLEAFRLSLPDSVAKP